MAATKKLTTEHSRSKLVPELRFKEFNGGWKTIKLGEICQTFKSGESITSNNIFDSGTYPVYGGNGLRGYTNNFTHDGFYTLIGRQGALCGNINRVYGKSFISEHAIAVSTNESSDTEWLAQKLNKMNLNRLSESSAQPGLAVNKLVKIKLNIPTLTEQQKIASFLSSVDEKIQQLTRKKELLEQYKKGVMQQLFCGKLRFKDENGKPYPKWEEKTLFDISEDVSYGMNAAATEFDGVHKYLRITDIDVDSGKFRPNPLTSPEGEIDDRFRLKENDIVFARTGASVGKSYLYNPNDGALYYAGFLIKFSIINANSYFVYSLTLRDEYDKWVHIYSMRSGQPGLNAEEYKALRLTMPSLPEQQKIADYLSAIDTKIESVANQITQTQTFKKGLLQQMFV